MRKFILPCLFLLLSSTLRAQSWQKMVMNGEKDFIKIQNAFYQEWDGKQIERGSSYKQFKRWEYRMLPRLIDGRFLPDIAQGYFIKKSEKERLANSRTADNTWQSLGPNSWSNGPDGYNPGMGRVNCLDIHPTNPAILFAGTPGGGLWKSLNSGVTWNPVFEDLPILGVTDFYIDPTNTDKYYLLTGDGYGGHTNSIGVFISEDAGSTWTASGFNPEVTNFYRNYRMIVDPTNSNIIFVAGNGGLLKSTDGGANWNSVLNGFITDVEFKPGDATTMYASNGSGAFYRSTNSGANWTLILAENSGLGRTAIGVSEANPQYVYMLASTNNSRFGGVYKSTDSGASIQLQSDSPNIFGYSPTAEDDRGQGWYDLAIAVNPNDAEDIYVSGIHIWNSKDGGQSWFDEANAPRRLNYWVYDPNNTDNYVHADNHTLDFLDGELYAGCDGGIWKTSNLGESWTDLSSSLNISQFYRLGLDPNDPDRITAGAQDNGSNLRTSAGWTHLFGADGMEALIDYDDGNRVYTSYQNGGIIRFYNNNYEANIAFELTNPEGDIRESGGWITPFVLDPNNSETIYLGLNNIWKSENRGNTWTRLSDFGSTATQLHISISALDSDYIYATSGWNAYRTLDGGVTWQPITNGLPSEYMTYISVSEDDPQTVYATFSGYTNGQKVYKSTNAGSTWTNISTGLPNIPVNCIVDVKNTNDQLYVGTDVGVYQREGDGTWQPWFEGLPNVEVKELEVHYGVGKIRAATFGRGIWERNIAGRLTLNAISANITEIIEGETITFEADYDGEPSEIIWDFQGGSPATSNEPNPTITYNQPGTFDVTLTIKGVNSPSITLSDYILVNDRVEITSLFASSETPRLGEEIVFDVSVNGLVDSWNWTFEGGTPSTSTEENPFVRYLGFGTFDVTVEVIGVNNAVEVYNDLITVLTPLSAIEEEQAIISPTVSSTQVKVLVAKPNSSIRIHDVSGKLVYSKVVQNGEINVPIDNLKSGLYNLQIISEESTQKGKFIKR